jgi:hypothetical protein
MTSDDATSGVLSDRKHILLGTKPIMLRAFKSKGVSHVFAASDRPTVIYSANKKLLYSNLNENEVCVATLVRPFPLVCSRSIILFLLLFLNAR